MAQKTNSKMPENGNKGSNARRVRAFPSRVPRFRNVFKNLACLAGRARKSGVKLATHRDVDAALRKPSWAQTKLFYPTHMGPVGGGVKVTDGGKKYVCPIVDLEEARTPLLLDDPRIGVKVSTNEAGEETYVVTLRQGFKVTEFPQPQPPKKDKAD